MAKSAGVVVPSAFPHPIGVHADHRSSATVRHTLLPTLSEVLDRFKDRIQAKLAFHDPGRYRALVHQAFQSSGMTACEPLVFHKLRKLDPDGLGIWHLARGGSQPRLADLCRTAIGLPGLGPPRAIARLLDRAW